MAKDNRILALVLIVGLVVLAIFLLKPEKKVEIPVDIGTDFPAEVRFGVCTSREGIDIGLCCAIWNDEIEDVEWVLCENLVLEPYPEEQAFFTFEMGSTLQDIAGILYVIKLTNEGNFDTDVKISSITVTQKIDGDAFSVAEIKNGLNTLVGISKPVTKLGGSVEYGMHVDDVIRLDYPSGVNMFEMADGTYSFTIDILAKDEAGAWIDAGTRTVDMKVEQEVVSFTIDVSAVV